MLLDPQLNSESLTARLRCCDETLSALLHSAFGSFAPLTPRLTSCASHALPLRIVFPMPAEPAAIYGVPVNLAPVLKAFELPGSLRTRVRRSH